MLQRSVHKAGSMLVSELEEWLFEDYSLTRGQGESSVPITQPSPPFAHNPTVSFECQGEWLQIPALKSCHFDGSGFYPFIVQLWKETRCAFDQQSIKHRVEIWEIWLLSLILPSCCTRCLFTRQMIPTCQNCWGNTEYDGGKPIHPKQNPKSFYKSDFLDEQKEYWNDNFQPHAFNHPDVWGHSKRMGRWGRGARFPLLVVMG